MNPLTLYVNPDLQKETLRVSPLLYPLWEREANETVSYSAAFTQHPFDTTYYQNTDNPDRCDCHLWPFNYWATLKNGKKSALDAAYTHARTHGKKLVIDAFGDTMSEVPYEEAIVLRFARYRRHLKSNDIILPAYIEDLLETHRSGMLALRKKGALPSIGFAGWGTLPFRKHLRTYVKEVPVFLWSLIRPRDGVFRKGVFIRGKALTALLRSSRVTCDFLIRTSYSGHVGTAEKSSEELRKEFIDNIDRTDYTLCVKGDANQSTRFYEVLSLGRIPLLLDTECVFPLEDKINYKDFCIFIDHRDLDEVGEILAQKHQELIPERFESMQKQGREVFERYLRIDAFTEHLVEEVRKRLS